MPVTETEQQQFKLRKFYLKTAETALTRFLEDESIDHITWDSVDEARAAIVMAIGSLRRVYEAYGGER